MSYWLKISLWIVLLCLGGCSKKASNIYKIGIDASWYPLEVEGQEKNIFAFSIELLAEIAKQQKIQIAIVNRSWDNLLLGLDEQKYDAILSTMYPYSFYLRTYSFSLPYLATGPVLVTLQDASIQGVQDLKGETVGVILGSSAGVVLQKVPGITLKNYNSTAQVLMAVDSQEVGAGVANILLTQNYIKDLYANRLKIVGAPISKQGLRLMTLFQKAPRLLAHFEKGLSALKSSGKYDKLLEKWDLSPTSRKVVNLDEQIEHLLQQSLYFYRL